MASSLPVLIARRLDWIQERVLSGHATSISVSLNAENGLQKIKFTIDNGCTVVPRQSCVLDILQNIRGMANKYTIVDTGHASHTANKSYICFWCRARPTACHDHEQYSEDLRPEAMPPPAPPPLRNEDLNHTLERISAEMCTLATLVYSMYNHQQQQNNCQSLIEAQNISLSAMHGHRTLEGRLDEKLELIIEKLACVDNASPVRMNEFFGVSALVAAGAHVQRDVVDVSTQMEILDCELKSVRDKKIQAAPRHSTKAVQSDNGATSLATNGLSAHSVASVSTQCDIRISPFLVQRRPEFRNRRIQCSVPSIDVGVQASTSQASYFTVGQRLDLRFGGVLESALVEGIRRDEDGLLLFSLRNTQGITADMTYDQVREATRVYAMV